MNQKLRTLIFSTVGLAMLFGAPTQAGWDHRVDTALKAEEEAQKHPKKIVHTLAVPSEVTDGGAAFLCFAYARDFIERFQAAGRIKIEVEHGRLSSDGDVKVVQVLSINSLNIRKNKAFKCKEAGEFLEDDILRATYRFPSAPRMRGVGKKGLGSINVITAVAEKALTVEDFFPPPPPEPNCNAGSGSGGGSGGSGGGSGGSGGGSGGSGGGGGGGGGGGSTSGDILGVQQLRGCAGPGVGIQFKWRSGKLYTDRRDPGFNVIERGPYPTYAAAGAAAAQAYNCQLGQSVASSAAPELPRLVAWGSAGGDRLLALRFERSGGVEVYVDAYSRATGAIHGSKFGTIAGAIRNFCGRSDISC